MYFMTKYEELEGKRVVFNHMAQFAKCITIGTDDGGILVVYFECGDDEDIEIRVANEGYAERYVFNDDSHKWMIKEMVQKGVITEGEYEQFIQKRKEKQEAQQKQWKQEQEDADRQNYQRLKAKYESVEGV